VIAKDGVPQFVRIIPTGGADLTQALNTGLEIEAEEAETIKRSLGLATEVTSAEEHRAVEIIYQVTSELLGSLRNTVSYFVNTRPQDPVRQIVLTGGGAQLPGLAHALGEMARLPVVIGDPFASIKLAHALKTDDMQKHRSSLTVALGLALGSAA
jgi:type IV pilus assembly protein PilM